MKNSSHKLDYDPAERHPTGRAGESPRIDRVAKGVATGVTASIIVQTGRNAIGTLAKNPLFVFGMGLAVGYFASKYRKEILSVGRQGIKQSSDFVARQKKNLKEMIANCQEQPETEDTN